jgi:tetratricopeptide (TPR) repeat protein
MTGRVRWCYAGVAVAALLLTTGGGLLLTSCAGKGSGPQQVAPGPTPSEQLVSAPKVEPLQPAAPKLSPQEAAALKRCRDLVYSGEYKQAVPACDDAVKAYPDSAEAKYLLAYSLQATHQRYDEAVKLYDEAESQGFSKFWVNYNRGLLYLWGMKDQDKAKADLQRALELDPTGEHKAVLTGLLAKMK